MGYSKDDEIIPGNAEDAWFDRYIKDLETSVEFLRNGTQNHRSAVRPPDSRPYV